MIKPLLSFLTASALLIPAVASSQESAHTTNFSLVTSVGENNVRYSLSSKQRVVMPTGVNWECNSFPVTLASDGSVYSAGFICKNSKNDVVSIQANCYTNKPDQELHSVALTTSDDNTGVIRFIASCATVANGETTSPYLRRTSVQ